MNQLPGNRGVISGKGKAPRDPEELRKVLSGRKTLTGCGMPIGAWGHETTCGVGGVCPKCWAVQNDRDPDTLRAERDRLREQGQRMADAILAIRMHDDRVSWDEAEIARSEFLRGSA